MAPAAALLLGPIVYEEAYWKALSPDVTLKEFRTGTREEFINLCKSGEYDDVMAIYRTNISSEMVTGPFTEEIISILPSSVKYICHNGAGYDNIDVAACTKRGISVSYTPGENSDAVADHILFLMLGALRQMSVPILALRRGEWRGKWTFGHDPENKVLGILGMGAIGKAVAKRASAFGMKIQYHNRHAIPDSEYKYVTFDELISTSDVISLNLNLTASTTHIISSKEFDNMKTGVVIVNTARGPLIDEEALVAALNSGKVYSAGLDVYEHQPKIHPELLKNEKVVLTPYIAAGTVETFASMELVTLKNVRSGIFDQKLLNPVPEQRK